MAEAVMAGKCKSCDYPYSFIQRCPHQWQPIETTGIRAWDTDGYGYRQREDGQWFRMPLPPLPEAEHDQ